jgi:hypothetical protein
MYNYHKYWGLNCIGKQTTSTSLTPQTSKILQAETVVVEKHLSLKARIELRTFSRILFIPTNLCIKNGRSMFQKLTRHHIPKERNLDSISRKINYKRYVTSDSTLPKLPGPTKENYKNLP